MPQNFLGCDRDQSLLMPPDLREWLAEDHLAYFVIDAVELLDLGPFYASYRSDGHGAAAHDPKMMLTLLLYAYATGTSSSREIERRLSEDVAYRVIAANQRPDHATIARFRVRHQGALAELFTQILALCAEAGMLTVGVISVDGSKLRAAASDRAVATYGQIADELLAEADRVDAAEDQAFGDARGDELPEGLRVGGDRKQRLKEARDALEAKRTAEAKPIPRDRAERLAECKARLESDAALEHKVRTEHHAWRQRGVALDGTKRMAGKHVYEPPPERAEPTGKLNTTDPDARRMKFGHNYLPAYNAQAVTNERQLIVAAEITTQSGDVGGLEPMVEAAEREIKGAGSSDELGVVLADAGYWVNREIDSLRARGLIPLIAPDATPTKPRKTRQGGPYDFMRRALASDAGRALYSRRIGMIEPVFGQIKANRGMNRIRRRGRAAARTEWRLIAATHNLMKLYRHGLQPATG